MFIVLKSVDKDASYARLVTSTQKKISKDSVRSITFAQHYFGM